MTDAKSEEVGTPADQGASASRAEAKIRINVFGRTDVGQIREHNEDNFLVADLTKKSRSLMESDRTQIVGRRGTLFVVCDGMGGAAAGEVASQFAVDIIYERLVGGEPPLNRDDLARRLVEAVEDAGVRIFNDARADRTRRGMGTTATAAALIDDRLFVAQVGDSRAYILRGDRLVQVSRDQSLVNQLIEAGQLTEEEAETFEHNNIILQALGTADTVQVDLTYADLREGDLLMMCSDGLSGMMRGDEIREVLLNTPDPLDACKVLTERANLAGGHDNITVIVARFENEGPDAAYEGAYRRAPRVIVARFENEGPDSTPALLSPPAPGDVLAYTKYPLPEASTAEVTVRASALSAKDLDTGDASDEALRESRKLRVGHTMIGMQSPVSDLEADDVSKAPSRAPKTPSTPPPVFSSDDEPVLIPTTGWPPLVVGLTVLGVLLVVAVTGIVFLR